MNEMVRFRPRGGGWIPSLAAVLFIGMATSSIRAQALTSVTVNTTAATLDGTTTSVAALTANPGPDGKISLVEAVTAVNNSGPGFTIRFDLPHGSAILAGQTLHILVANTTVDGDADGDGKPDVVINRPDYSVALSFSADHGAVRNLAISGLELTGASAHDCQVVDCYLGTDVDGRAASPSHGNGMEILNGAHHNTVLRCILSGNTAPVGGNPAAGMYIISGSHDNVVQSCRIGVNVDGVALPNELGLVIGTNDGSTGLSNLIGGVRPADGSLGPGNVISGNTLNALEILAAGSTGNVVQGNYIGLDPTGLIAIPNGGPGKSTAFFVGRGASGNTIGGERTTQFGGPGNVISGNTGVGFRIRYAGTTGNTVQGNFIGTNALASVAIPNGDAGIVIQGGAAQNLIGTTTPSSGLPTRGNLISGNAGAGVMVMDADSRRNTIRGNVIQGNGGLGIDLSASDRPAGDHVTPNDDTDGDLGPNDLMNFPVGVFGTYDAHRDKTTVSGLLPSPAPNTATVDIYVNKSVDPSGFGEGEQYLGSATPDASGAFHLVVPGRLPAGFLYLSATATDASGNTSEFGPVYGDPDGDGSTDDDGDGLPDDWETKGIDFNGDGTVDLALNQAPFSANAQHKDIFVEIDYMEAADHTHKPASRPDKTALPADPLAAVVAAFATAPLLNPDNGVGITLHPMVDEAIPEVASVQFLGQGPGANDDFDDLKLGNPPGAVNGYLGTAAERTTPNAVSIIGARRLAFRYCIFGHDSTDLPGASGIAEIGGNDFFVTLRSHVAGADNDFEDQANTIATTWGTTFDQEWSDLVAATFMHELGHTLGLHHGGGEGIPDALAADRDVNCKPNYISIMRYGRQFDEAGAASGIPGVADGTTVRLHRSLDYSRDALAALDEAHLNELDGVGGPSGELTLWGIGGARQVSPTDSSIDWNGNGSALQPSVADDVNYIADKPSCPASPGEKLNGHDDWNNLLYDFRGSPDFSDGDHQTAETMEENHRDYLIGCLGGLPGPGAALKIAAGLKAASRADMALLNVVTTGLSASRIDLADAARLLRERNGLGL